MGKSIEALEQDREMPEIDDLFGLYLYDMPGHPLLSDEQEIMLANQIVRARQAQAELQNGNNLTEQKRRETERAILDGVQARTTFTLANQGLVIDQATKLAGGNRDKLLDLIGEGNLALARAIEGFVVEEGCRFSTYATPAIGRRLRDAVRKGKPIPVPRDRDRDILDMRGKEIVLIQESGSQPDSQMLARAVGKPVHYVNDLKSWDGLTSVSLHSPAGEDGELRDLIGIDQGVEQAADFLIQVNRSREIMATSLPAREERVLLLRYGLLGGQAHTLKEIGQKFGLNRERIRQIEASGLRRLKARMPV